MDRRRTIKRLLGREDGFALASAIVVLAIVSALAAVAVTVSTQTSTSTTRDNNTKAALEAAESGLRVATYRLNMLKPEETKCINGNAVVEPAGGVCEDQASEALDNHGTFIYADTPGLKAGESCVGPTVSNNTGVIQRCVTAVGNVNGVVRRVQARVAAFTARPLFPVSGVIGLEEVNVNNSAHIKAPVATNGTLHVNNEASVGEVTLGKGGKVEQGPKGTVGPVKEEPTQFTLSPVDPGNSATVNENFRITNGKKSPKTEPYDESNSKTKLEGVRELSVSNNATLTLGGGTYNFCSLILNNHSTITIAAGVKTRIFIDSPEDTRSGCPAGSGNLQVTNESSFVNPSKDPTALQIYVYGNKEITFTNHVAFYGTLYAPSAAVNIVNEAGFFGAVAGRSVKLVNNGEFLSDSRVEKILATTTGIYYRTAWAECTPSSSFAGSC